MRPVRSIGALGLLCCALGLVARSSAHAAKVRWPMQLEVQPVPGVSAINAVATTKDGFVWIGSGRGLGRWDGLVLRWFDGADPMWPALPGHAVTQLEVTADGRLWVGTVAGLWTLSPDLQLEPAGVTEAIVGLRAAGDAIWVASSAGVHRLMNGNWRHLPWPEAGLGEEIDALDTDAAGNARFLALGRLWVVGPEMRSVVPQVLPQTPADRRTALAHVPRAGFIGALVRDWPPGAPDAFEAMADRDGVVWTATYDGMFHRVPGQAAPGNRVPELPRTAFWNVREDVQGNVWTIGFGASLFRISSPKRTALMSNEGRGGDAAFAVIQGKDGTVYVSTEHGLDLYAQTGHRRVTPKMGLPSYAIRGLAIDGKNRIWLTTLDDGLIRYDGTSFTRVGRAQGLPSESWHEVIASGDGVVAASADGRVIRLDAAGGWQPVAGLDDASCVGGQPCARRVRSITSGPDGARLWFCTEGHGLVRIDDTGMRTWGRDQGLLDDGLNAAIEDGRGLVWVATDQGLFRLDGRAATKFGRSTGMPQHPIFQVVNARTHRGVDELWMGTENGVLRVERRQLDDLAEGRRSTADVRRYTVADGLAFDEVIEGFHPGVLAASDGLIWFTSVRGLILFDPNRMERQPASIRIENVFSKGRAIDPGRWRGQSLSLEARARDVEIAYAAPVFVDVARIRYSYRLSGLADEWIDVGARRSAYFTHLGPGSYQFTVQASAEDSQDPPPRTTFTLSIAPYFYETWPFRIAVVLVVLGLILGSVRLRTRRIAAGYAALTEERTRIARDFHDTLGQVFAATGRQLDSLERAVADDANVSQLVRPIRNSLTHGRLAARRALWSVRGTVDAGHARRPFIESLRELRMLYEDVSFVVSCEGTVSPLPERTEQELLRIAEEAVSNAIAHGRAQRVSIALEYEDRRFSLWVRDDGTGFEPAPPGSDSTVAPERGGLGLVGMRERARAIGGTLMVHSEPGVGTEVGVVVDLIQATSR